MHSNRVFPPLKRTAEFDDLLLMSTSQNVPLIANFNAGWCPSCKIYGPILEATVQEEEERINVVRIEIDEAECSELARRYQITSLPTYIVFRRGFGEAEELKGNKLSKQNIKEWVHMMGQRGRQDRGETAS